MKNDLLWEIMFVLDTIGKNKKFGNFKNGNGYVTEYTDYDGIPENEGKYVNGNKEGWWRTYHFTGSIMDSTFYKEGFPLYEKSDNALDELIGSFGLLKNNLYKYLRGINTCLTACLNITSKKRYLKKKQLNFEPKST